MTYRTVFDHKFQTYDKDLKAFRLDAVGGAGFGGGAGRRDLAEGLGIPDDVLSALDGPPFALDDGRSFTLT